MSDDMARTLAHWSDDSLNPADPPMYSYAIAMGCFDYLKSVLRYDVPGKTLQDRVPEEEIEERVKLAEWIFEVAQRAQGHYVDSKEAEAAAVRSLEEGNEKVVALRSRAAG